PGMITTYFSDLGAQVIKVESPEGDYIREMTWPIVNGVSLLHLHVHRGKQSITLDLRKPEGVAVYRDLAKDDDVVGEAAGLSRAARPRLRRPARDQPEDRVLQPLGLRHDRPVPEPARARHRVR